jgi:hypothetical protein
MKKLVHTRKISMKASDLGDHTIEVEGDLIDHRCQPEHQAPSEGSELVHHMVVRLKIRGPALFIEQAEASMPHHPRQECPVVLPWIQKLEGVRIAPGFTMKVKRLVGGKNGCAHLTSLIIAMGESAVQGYLSAYGAGRGGERGREQDLRHVSNTCYLWREDGPLVRELRESLESQASSERSEKA